MADNAMERIRQSEILADESIRRAHQEAVNIVDSAKRDAERLLRESEDAAIAREEETLAALHSQNEEALTAAQTELGQELEWLAAKAREGQDHAVTAVIHAIA